MPTEITLPRLGDGMDEGRILRWLKREGDVVVRGEEIYEVETEKVNVEVEAPASGILLKIVSGPGATVPVGAVIGLIGDAGAPVPDVRGAPGLRHVGRGRDAAQAPAITLTVDVDMEAAIAMQGGRGGVVARGEAARTLEDILTKACRAALQQHPGLGTLLPGDEQGSTFAILDAGALGVDQLTPVVVPPLVSVVAAGRVRDAVVPAELGPEVRARMTVTLACDHRAVEVSTAARFLGVLKRMIEQCEPDGPTTAS